MSVEMFAGFITGNIIALMVGAFAILYARKKGGVQDDERTVQVRLQTGTTAFYLTGVLTYIGWIADNYVAYLNGEAIRVFSPLGMLLCAMGLIWLVAYIYNERKVSTDDYDPAEIKKRRTSAAALFGMAAAVGGIQAALQNTPLELRLLMGGLQMILLVLGGSLLWKGRKQSA